MCTYRSLAGGAVSREIPLFGPSREATLAGRNRAVLEGLWPSKPPGWEASV